MIFPIFPAANVTFFKGFLLKPKKPKKVRMVGLNFWVLFTK